MKLLMKLTSHLLIETLSDSDYIMVYVSNTKCNKTDNLIPVNSSSRQLIDYCVDAELDITTVISLCAACKEFNRYLAMLLTYTYISCLNYLFNKANEVQYIKRTILQLQKIDYASSGSKHQ